ncbi:MAG: 1-acyl-sn-glycerol-3-phosphate acyltransferase [Bacteroidetes bacterium SB0662_bin_6]|nr:1-acyl-sn-glycerol-3-phosphate acyltransferase [Bacteroidetes bacterium SB0668_bin_1]MYE04181.1 1-acyl-sn-glycerol-3-phosphate acyltransferase [Bacteroidetes bacterium SB0662_bin_6]
MYRLLNVLRIFRLMLSRASQANRKAAGLERREELQCRAEQIHEGCAQLCELAGIRVRAKGNIPDRSGMLVVANHFTVLDPLILASVAPMVPVARADLQGWPIIGNVSMAHGMIPVDRDRRTAAASFVKRVGERLAAGLNVLVFPEGNTSEELAIRPFKTGAFEAVAGQAGGMVVPAYLSLDSVEDEPATDDVRRRIVWLEHTSFWAHIWGLAALRGLEYTVHIGEPISTEGRNRKKLAQLARNAVEQIRMSLHPVRT